MTFKMPVLAGSRWSSQLSRKVLMPLTALVCAASAQAGLTVSTRVCAAAKALGDRLRFGARFVTGPEVPE